MRANEIEVFVEICRDDAIVPKYARSGDAGMDVCSAEEITIEPGETTIIPTGLKLAIPLGYEIQVRPRSGISYKTPIRISNSPGTIDSGYRDELGIIVTNTSNDKVEENLLNIESTGNKKGTYIVKKGERIAQIVLKEVPIMKLTKVDCVKSIGENRGGGFGSTGV